MPGGQILSFGPYRLDTEKVQLWREAQPLRLTPKAFQVLCYVVERPGQLVSKEELFRVVWADTVVSDAALTTCIQEIRKALQDNPKSPRYVETVHRLGFRFIAPVATAAAPGPSSELQVPSQEEVDGRKNGEANGRGHGQGGITHQAAGHALAVQANPLDARASGHDGQNIHELRSDRIIPAQAYLEHGRGVGIQEQESPVADSSHKEVSSTPATDSPVLPSVSPASSRFTRGFVLAAVLFLIGTVLTVQYLSRPTLSTQDSALSPQGSQALPLPDKPSIIVLPFVNLSGNPGQDYFSDGLTDVLTGDLSMLSGLFVIARDSAFTYKGKAVKMQDVGREMGVRYVLEGSVQKTAGQVRITAQLIEAATGEHLWSERYDRPLQNLFALQDEIVHQIITNLGAILWQAEVERVRRIPTANFTAYDALLRGAEYYRRYTKEDNLQARQMWEKAIALDPQYAEAYAALGWTYWLAWAVRWSADPQSLEQAAKLAHQALALNDSLPSAHTVL